MADTYYLVPIFEALLERTLGPLWADDPSLIETPSRMARAWAFAMSGYETNIDEMLKTFPAPPGGSEMIMVRDIDFYSKCEHHGEPFFGTATVAYIPSDKIIGLSKIARIVDAFSRKLQVQERLTNEIADALCRPQLAPIGVGVITKARHLCMECRGVQKQGQTTVTSALRGVVLEAPVRAEFLALASA